MTTQSVPITVLIATIRGWPDCREAVRLIAEQVFPADGEFIVADASGNPPPSDREMAELGGPIRWLELPGRSVFQLRHALYRAASGDIVAITEDHCYVAPDWVERILEAHRRHPNAAAVGGTVLNNTDQKLVDWAAFFLTQGPFMPPLANGVSTRISGPANVSYKRWALERHDPDDGSGFMAILYNRRLAEAGEILRVDDRIVVDHFETTGLGWTTSIHFHNGRTISGFRRARGMTGEEWLRIATALLLPAWRTARVVRVGLGKGRLRRQLVASVALCLWLEYVQGTGHLVGYLLGPGGSPNHLR